MTIYQHPDKKARLFRADLSLFISLPSEPLQHFIIESIQVSTNVIAIAVRLHKMYRGSWLFKYNSVPGMTVIAMPVASS